MVGIGERALLAMSALVALVSLAGLVAVVLAGLNERRRELAVLRAVGAGPRHVLLLLAAEGALVTLLGVAARRSADGAAASPLAGRGCRRTSASRLRLSAPDADRVAAARRACWPPAMLASLLPALRAYRLSLADGLSPRHLRPRAMHPSPRFLCSALSLSVLLGLCACARATDGGCHRSARRSAALPKQRRRRRRSARPSARSPGRSWCRPDWDPMKDFKAHRPSTRCRTATRAPPRC